jgi:hypothetical protein
MTIGIGILASDGYVIASDTQITHGQLKTQLGKVQGCHSWDIEHGEGACLVTGSGIYSHIADLGRRLAAAFASNKSASKPGEIETIIKAQVFEFYKLHAEADVDVILAYERNNRFGMWSSDGTVLMPQPKYAAVGIGALYGNALLSRLCPTFPPTASVRETLAMAAYILRQVKDSIDGCGGSHTDMAFITGHRLVRLSKKVTKELDTIFSEYLTDKEPLVLHGLFGSNDHARVSGRILRSVRVRLNKALNAIPELNEGQL